MGGELQQIWRIGLQAQRHKNFPSLNNGNNRRRGGKTWGRRIFISARSKPGYHLGGEGSDKSFSY
jgi:hypothetical protein